jgi:hypothetical protein
MSGTYQNPWGNENIDPFAVFENVGAPQPAAVAAAAPVPAFVPPPLQIPPFVNNSNSGTNNSNATNATRRNRTGRNGAAAGRNSNAVSVYNVNGDEMKSNEELLKMIRDKIDRRDDRWTEKFYMNYGNVPEEERYKGFNSHRKTANDEINRLREILKRRGVYVNLSGFESTKNAVEAEEEEQRRFNEYVAATRAEAAAEDNGEVKMPNNNNDEFHMSQYAQAHPPTPPYASAAASAAPWAPARPARGALLHPYDPANFPGAAGPNGFVGRLNEVAAAATPNRRGSTKRKSRNENGKEAKRVKTTKNGYNANNNTNENLEGGRRKHGHTKKCKCKGNRSVKRSARRSVKRLSVKRLSVKRTYRAPRK